MNQSSNQDDLINFVISEDTLRKAVEGSMDKRLAKLEAVNQDELENLSSSSQAELDNILKPLEKYSISIAFERDLAKSKAAILKHFRSVGDIEAAIEIFNQGHGGGNWRRLLSEFRKALNLGEKKL